MGQMASGILYGCEAPALPDTESDEPIYDLICRWEKHARISWHSKGLKVTNEHEGGKDLLGVWVAVGGSGEDGAACFLEQCLPLDQVPQVYAKNIAKAKALWDRFAVYVAKKERIELPAPTLWLTPTETA